MKQCSKCRKVLEVSLFYKKGKNLSSHCKFCLKEANRIRYQKKQQSIKEKTNQYYKDNKDMILNKQKKKREALPEDRKFKLAEYQKEYRKKNKENIKETRQKWYLKTQNTRRAYSKEYIRQWNKQNKHIVLWCTLLSTCITRLKTAKTDTTVKQLGYTHQQLKQHMEKHFTDLMTWENHGSYWNAHHNIPVTWFRPDTPASVVSSLDNLYPLDKKVNYSIGNKRLYFEVVEGYKKEAYKWLHPDFKIFLDDK